MRFILKSVKRIYVDQVNGEKLYNIIIPQSYHCGRSLTTRDAPTYQSHLEEKWWEKKKKIKRMRSWGKDKKQRGLRFSLKQGKTSEEDRREEEEAWEKEKDNYEEVVKKSIKLRKVREKYFLKLEKIFKYIKRGLPPLCYERKVFDPRREKKKQDMESWRGEERQMREMEECIVTTKLQSERVRDDEI